MKKSTKLLFGLGAISAIAYGANRYMYYIATKDQLLSIRESYSYNWTYGSIHYIKKGKGTPLLLLHDITFYGSNYEFDTVINRLAKHYTVYALDFLGCGQSEKPKMEYTNFLYVQMLCSFIENVIGGKTSVFASNRSTSVALMSKKYQPDLFDKIILGNPQDIYEAPGIRPLEKLVTFGLELPLFGTLAYNLLSTKDQLTKLMKASFYNRKKCSDSLIDHCFEAAHLGDADAKYIYLSMQGKYLAANTIPALEELEDLYMILGESRPGGIEIVSHYKKFVKNTHIYKIPETKDLPQLESPERFAKALLHAMSQES